MKKKQKDYDGEITQDSPQTLQNEAEKAPENTPKYFSTKVELYRRTK